MEIQDKAALFYAPKRPLSNFSQLFIFRKLVAEREFNAIVVFGHDGGLPVGPEEEHTL